MKQLSKSFFSLSVILAPEVYGQTKCKQSILDDAYITIPTFHEGKQHDINILEKENFNVQTYNTIMQGKRIKCDKVNLEMETFAKSFITLNKFNF